jgi:hypothetical protein
MGHNPLGGLYILCVHKCARSVRSHIVDGLSPNLLGIYYESPQVAWAITTCCMYFSCSSIARVRGLYLDVFSPNLVKHTTGDHNLHGLRTYIAHARMYTFAHLWTDSLLWWKHTTVQTLRS